jgi:hypothetical protein
VSVQIIDAAAEAGGWEFEGVPVIHRSRSGAPSADVVVYHADYPRPAREIRKRTGAAIVAVCHNAELAVRLGLHNTGPDLITVNAEWMREQLGGIVVRPPLDPVEPLDRPGECVSIVNVNENKSGPFWDVAAAMPETRFLVVRGGYGEQTVPDVVPANVEVIDHVPAAQMREAVWSRTRVLLVPSQRETWGSTASEAMAHGIPVIAAPTPGLIENLAHAGVYADRSDPASWVTAIRVLADPDVWADASARCLARAAELHASTDVESWCDAVESLGGARDVASAG